MNIVKDFSLTNYNTFHIDVKADYFCEIHSLEDLQELLSHNIFLNNNRLILGGGSNILFTSDFSGLVIKNSIKSIEEIHEDEHFVFVKAGAGVIWDELVNYCVNKNYGGIENLTYIPGTVGAAPIQNIGAYGAELKDVFYSLEGVVLKENKLKEFYKKDCYFGYRSSIFKNEYKNKIFISSVTLKLNKIPKINIEYSALKESAKNYKTEELTVAKISEIVKEIRKSKLPDPSEFGNAGSFFKNPEVDKETKERLENEFEDIISFNTDKDIYKIPAGWLIEKCGLKGFRLGNTGTYKKQALVIINFNNASGKEIYEFSNFIKDKVYNKFQIELETEVNVV
ncbi:MAG: UDP-N-acetylmuramate dehydrogenase [Bacteroidetes bacterium]|nr:UDP-N-acetylmuramate dehydrogenase [Bacteroidota bacterium]